MFDKHYIWVFVKKMPIILKCYMFVEPRPTWCNSKKAR